METANADGNSSLALKFYENRAGTMQVSSTYTCTYAVEPSGRVTLSSDTQSCGATPPVFYLTGLNTGFIVDASPGVDTGSFEPQSAGPFNNASLGGNLLWRDGGSRHPKRRGRGGSHRAKWQWEHNRNHGHQLHERAGRGLILPCGILCGEFRRNI